jgi:thiol-disulfide isomerase/thioredoxin
MTRPAGHLALLFVITLLGVGCSGQVTKPQNAGQTGSVDATVKLVDLDYNALQELIARQKGKIVVLDCWSTSCDPCVRDFHNLVELQKKHGADKLACISLSFDFEGLGTREDVRSRVLTFLREQGATFDNVLSTLTSDELAKKLTIASIPAVFVYDRDGTMRRRFDNEDPQRHPFNYGQVSDTVDQLLAEPVVAIALDDVLIKP